MNYGTLAKTLMQKAVRIGGDAAQSVTLLYIGQPVYDPGSGGSTTPTTPQALLAFFGSFSNIERARWGLNETAKKLVFANADAPSDVTSGDMVQIGTAYWSVSKVLEDLLGASVILAIEPTQAP